MAVAAVGAAMAGAMAEGWVGVEKVVVEKEVG